MEELLNKLIEKGWKPFWTDNKVFKVLRTKNNWWYFDWWFWNEICFSLREIVSKESWLWQFCIANHLLKKYSDLWDDDEYIIWRWQNWMDWKTTDWEYIDENYDSDIYHQDESYQYRLIESALCDEDKLEEFLLSNIKVWNED